MNTLHRPALPSVSEPVAVDMECHPATPCAARFSVQTRFTPQRSASGWMLQMVYEVTGDVQRLRLPQLAESGPADGLWAHTCFEAFFSEPGSSAYRECNFSPSTRWAHYRFTAERLRDGGAPNLAAPVISAPYVTSDRLVLTASMAAAPLPQESSALICAPTAVLELTDGSLSYWAVQHPTTKPDFHTRVGWSVPLRWAIL